MHDIPDDLGRRLAARRRELGLTAEEVERRAGLEAGYVSYVEEQPMRRRRAARCGTGPARPVRAG